jgi:hypothetical protein
MRFSILIFLRQMTALLLVCALPVATSAAGPPLWQQQPATTPDAATVPANQLDSLVAPIALYPDPLLAQILVASTYPLEVIQLQQWLDQNPGLKDHALQSAVEQQGWDASVQALAPMADVVKILSQNIKWTADLGNVFLAQQNDVMDAVQRMRVKAKTSGKLQSSQQQTVETQVVEQKEVIVIQPADPQVIYVPTYDPTWAFGDPYYPYPPMSYPPAYAPGFGLGFGLGFIGGAIWGGGGWGWGCGWGGNNNVYVNHNNNFINNNDQRINNLKGGNRASQLPANGRSNWQHDPGHRGGAPYGDRNTADRFGGNARGDSVANRQQTARQNPGNFGGNNRDFGGNRPGASQGDLGGNRQGGSMRDVSATPNNRGGGNLGGDGNRDISRGSGNGALGGASSGMNRNSARASQSRGSSSMSSRGSGGRSGGGGGRRR